MASAQHEQHGQRGGRIQRISPCLWFDTEAEQAAAYHTSVLPHARIEQAARYGAAGQEVHGRAPGSVMTVQFSLDGMAFTALNGGPQFRFTEAVSLQVLCDTQQKIDYYWDELGEGGDPAARMCGWLKDRFGLSWQIVPRELANWCGGPASPATERAMTAMLKTKLEIAALQRAHAGGA